MESCAEVAKGATVAAIRSLVAKGATAEAKAAGCTAVASVVWMLEMLPFTAAREALTSLVLAFGANPFASTVVVARGATVLASNEDVT